MKDKKIKDVVTRYYMTLIIIFIFFLLFGFTPMGYRIAGSFYIFIWIMLLVVSYFILWQFRCPRCGSSIVKRYIEFGDKKVWGVSLLPGVRCPSCGLDE